MCAGKSFAVLWRGRSTPGSCWCHGTGARIADEFSQRASTMAICPARGPTRSLSSCCYGEEAMMRWRLTVLTTVASAAMCFGTSGATPRQEPGEALFVLEARFSEPPRVGLPVKLGLMLLDFAGYPPDSSTVEARLILPQGWEVISGDTTYRGPIPRGELHWSLTVRPAHPGRYEIRRSVRIERGRFGPSAGSRSVLDELGTNRAWPLRCGRGRVEARH